MSFKSTVTIQDNKGNDYSLNDTVKAWDVSFVEHIGNRDPIQIVNLIQQLCQKLDDAEVRAAPHDPLLLIVKSWDDTMYSTDELIKLVEECEADRDGHFDDYFDGDLATLPALVKNLATNLEKVVSERLNS